MSHLRSVHRSCCSHGRTIQFWANALHDDPEQLWNLPPGLIAMEYGHTVHFIHSFIHPSIPPSLHSSIHSIFPFLEIYAVFQCP